MRAGDDWVNSTYISLPKKNKARRCDGHRTIYLMSHAAKIFMRIIFIAYRMDLEEAQGKPCKV